MDLHGVLAQDESQVISVWSITFIFTVLKVLIFDSTCVGQEGMGVGSA